MTPKKRQYVGKKKKDGWGGVGKGTVKQKKKKKVNERRREEDADAAIHIKSSLSVNATRSNGLPKRPPPHPLLPAAKSRALEACRCLKDESRRMVSLQSGGTRLPSNPCDRT